MKKTLALIFAIFTFAAVICLALAIHEFSVVQRLQYEVQLTVAETKQYQVKSDEQQQWAAIIIGAVYLAYLIGSRGNGSQKVQTITSQGETAYVLQGGRKTIVLPAAQAWRKDRATVLPVHSRREVSAEIREGGER